MKRVIKFRAWHSGLDHMFFPDEEGNFIGEIDDDRVCGHFGYSDLLNPVIDYPYIAMQFTGLTDKNGKEIYEGDVINDDKGIGVVYYYQPQFIVQCLPDEITTDGVYALAKGKVNITQLEESEVVGNIYENPELIK